MKTSSKMFLEEVSKHCSTQITHYTFNQNSLKVSDKYKEGRLSALNYVGELIFYFLQEEKHIKERFQKEIKTQMQKNSCLTESDYKKGLYDALNDVLSEVDRI